MPPDPWLVQEAAQIRYNDPQLMRIGAWREGISMTANSKAKLKMLYIRRMLEEETDA